MTSAQTSFSPVTLNLFPCLLHLPPSQQTIAYTARVSQQFTHRSNPLLLEPLAVSNLPTSRQNIAYTARTSSYKYTEAIEISGKKEERTDPPALCHTTQSNIPVFRCKPDKATIDESHKDRPMGIMICSVLQETNQGSRPCIVLGSNMGEGNPSRDLINHSKKQLLILLDQSTLDKWERYGLTAGMKIATDEIGCSITNEGTASSITCAAAANIMCRDGNDKGVSN